MFTKFRTAALSALVGLGMLAAMPASAEAASGSFSIGIGSGPAAMSFHFGTPHHHYRPYHPGYHHRRPACSERQALNRARDMGVRNARIVRADHRRIEVRGLNRWRGQTGVTFARAPHCPIIARF